MICYHSGCIRICPIAGGEILKGFWGAIWMKRLCRLLAFVLVGCFLFCLLPLNALAAGQKAQIKRSIAIVFDNSISMYGRTMAWSRATYAMEVFAAMLNEGDDLYIIPMNPIEVNGTEYTLNNPMECKAPVSISDIQNILSVPGNTHIESIEKACEKLNNDKSTDNKYKWLIVLTDGDEFFRNNRGFGAGRPTEEELRKCLEPASRDMNVLYFGFGGAAAVPRCTPQGPYKLEIKKESDTKMILSGLTAMCNTIFGRDTLPSSHFSGNKISTDVSLSKVIVFVQGENVGNVQLKSSSGNVLTAVQSDLPMYPEHGAGKNNKQYDATTDKQLQGVIVTYNGCDVGSYTLSYDGDASSVEVYYEPDVDMEFTFTDKDGNTIDPKQLIDGEYVIKFGMKDGRTGEYTESELLGNIEYQCTYTINGQDQHFPSHKKQDEITVTLETGDTFDASMVVTYLIKDNDEKSGYKIYKDSSDFGWPAGGITVQKRQAGKLELKISEGQQTYPLVALEGGKPFRAEVRYQGELLTGDALKQVELNWDPSKSGADVKKVFKDDHYDLVLMHKDPSAPDKTPSGQFSFPVTAQYAPPNTEETQSEPETVSYTITDDRAPLSVTITNVQDEYKLDELDDAPPIRIEIRSEGKPLSPEEFNKLEDAPLDFFGEMIQPEKLPDESAYLLRLKKTDAVKPGEYELTFWVTQIDAIGRKTEAEDKAIIRIVYNEIPLELFVTAPQNYYVIKDMDKGEPIRAELTTGGAKLTPEQFGCVDFEVVDAGGLEYTVKAAPGESAYLIYLTKTDSVKAGSYTIRCTASMTDEIGRTATDEDRTTITLSTMPMWIKLAFWGLLALILLLIILAILHIKALPTKLHTKKRDCMMSVDDEDVTKNATFDARIDRRRLTVQAKYAGKKIALAMDVRPGKGSYVKTPQAKRTAEVNSSSVIKQGNAVVMDATIGSVKYVLNEDTKKFERMPKTDKPFVLRNGVTIVYSGTLQSNGDTKSFYVRSKLNFKKIK